MDDGGIAAWRAQPRQRRVLSSGQDAHTPGIAHTLQGSG